MFTTKENPIFYEISGSADIQKVLERIDPIKLIHKISNFRKLNIRDMNDQQISEAIFDVLCWDGYFACYTNIKTYPAGTSFFRVKKFVGSNLPNERFGVQQDYWETPSKYLHTYGRLNKPGESLLYVSPDMSCAIKEMKLEDDEYFAVIKYTANDQIKVNMIGGDFNYDQIGEISEKAKLVHEIYRNFLCDEFSRDVGKGTEYLYRTSEKIAKDHFDLPPRVVQDAWAYTSVQDKTKYNVCFRPEIAHDLLELNGAMIYSHVTDTMQVQAAVSIDRKIGRTDAQMPAVEQTPTAIPNTPVNAPCAPAEPHPEPTPRKIRKSGTGCLYQINDNLWEGSFFPRLPGGKRKKFNVYAETKEQCEIKLAEMIERVKAEIAEEKAKLKEGAE